VEKEMVREDLMRGGRAIVYAAALSLVFSIQAGAGERGKDGQIAAAKQVLRRVLGARAASFDFTLVQGTDSVESFEVMASRGRVTVRGTSPVALVRGAYHYLRDACQCMVTWSGSHIVLPERLPDYARVTVSTPYRFRQYYNVCTFGYSTVWWDWARWEREIDWMALHGINMPLALVGQTSVWQRVWESFGIKRDSLRAFFTGPAFLPWHWMGNLNGHGGPLPQPWIKDQEVLQKKILGRMRELGMKPIVPAFSGFVPEAFHHRFPQERTFENVNWSGLTEDVKTFALMPGSPMYQAIGERFIKEYRRTYGPCKYYLADTFNELEVPVSAGNRYDELAGFGEAVYESIKRGDPSGVWVMQGWLFNDRAAFWDAASTRALLSRVPNDRMIIIDLANEEFQGWKRHPGFYGKQWIYSTIHNFGGNNPLRGNLPFVAVDPPSVQKDSSRGNLVGFGLSMEGIDNNEVMYELLTDMAWKSEPVNLDAWLREYALARYGASSSTAKRAWQLLQDAIYTKTSGHHMLFAFQYRPSLTPHSDAFTDKRIDEALDLMLADAARIEGSTLLKNDLVDLAVYVIGNRIDLKLSQACRAHLSADYELRDILAREAILLMQKLDAILFARLDTRLERWIAMARAEGKTREERDLFEQNARRQITVWGGPDLHEYAAKLWSGMVRDFYAGRWKLFFELLRSGQSEPEMQARLRLWDEEWWTRTELSTPEPVGDLAKAVRSLLTLEQSMTQVSREPLIRTATPAIVEGDTAVVTIDAEPGADVRYTIDGSVPVQTSFRYLLPLQIGSDQEIRARAFSPGHWNSTISALTISTVGKNNGLRYSYFPEPVSDLSDSAWSRLKPGRSGRAFDFVARPDSARKKNYAAGFSGYLSIDTPGEYTFVTESDDGSVLLIDGIYVVDNSGYHGARERMGTLKLDKGFHALEVRYFQSTGASVLNVLYSGPGISKQHLPMRKMFVVPGKGTQDVK
jgi:alpha-N-acetylglucosaminidase